MQVTHNLIFNQVACGASEALTIGSSRKIHTCIEAGPVAVADRASVSVCTHFGWESRGMIRIVRKRSRRELMPRSASTLMRLRGKPTITFADISCAIMQQKLQYSR